MTDLWGLLGTRTGRRTPTTPQMAVKMATGRTEAPMMICSGRTHPFHCHPYKYIKIAIIMTYMAYW